MTRSSWDPYGGGGALVLALVLFFIAGILVYLALRLRQPVNFKRTGRGLGIILVVLLILAVVLFVIAVYIYVITLLQQISNFKAPGNPITLVTLSSALVSFFVIIALARQHGPRVAIGSAIVGTMAAPMIFELPFDLIVMWRTHPPTPAVPFTLLFFLPLFLIEILCFALLTLSPLPRISRATLFLLAAFFGVFAIWALSGFAYTSAPLPTALNMISKVLAFAVAVSLFLRPGLPQASSFSR